MSTKGSRLTRQAAIRAERERQRRLRIVAIAGVAVVVAAGIIGFLVVRERQSPAEPGIASNVTATDMRVPDEGRNHVPNGEPVQYNHYPPSSGAHWSAPAAPVPWGVYSEPVPPEVWVHNLEHGGIVVLYNCPDGCPDTVAALKKLAAQVPNSQFANQKIVVAPDAKITSKIIALAWARELDLSDFDRARLLEFYKRWVDAGPEAVP